MTPTLVEVTVDGVTERPMTSDEIAQRQADEAEAQAAADAAAAAEAARVKAVQDAQAELAAMGLSDNTIATISGFPYPYSPAV